MIKCVITALFIENTYVVEIAEVKFCVFKCSYARHTYAKNEEKTKRGANDTLFEMQIDVVYL